MKKTNTTSEIREYTTNIDEPIVISRSLLEKAGIKSLCGYQYSFAEWLHPDSAEKHSWKTSRGTTFVL